MLVLYLLLSSDNLDQCTMGTLLEREVRQSDRKQSEHFLLSHKQLLSQSAKSDAHFSGTALVEMNRLTSYKF